MTHSISANRLRVVNLIIAKLVPELQLRGIYHAAGPTFPAHWMLTDYGLVMNFAEGVLLSPIEPALSSLLVGAGSFSLSAGIRQGLGIPGEWWCSTPDLGHKCLA